MKLAALFSGGKDSTYAIFLAKKMGHEVKYLATVFCKNPESYMFHTANIGLTYIQSQAMNIKLVSKQSEGKKEEEVHDLKVLLEDLDIDGVVCGAMKSEYQRSRVEKICKELNLKLIAPLWKKDSKDLWTGMLKNNFKIIMTAVAAQGLDKNWLGKIIDEERLEKLTELSKEFGIHLAGEGGEFETLVLDCPMFSRKIEVIDSEIDWKDDSGLFIIKDAKLKER